MSSLFLRLGLMWWKNGPFGEFAGTIWQKASKLTFS
jgi:hypothetical protein